MARRVDRRRDRDDEKTCLIERIGIARQYQTARAQLGLGDLAGDVAAVAQFVDAARRNIKANHRRELFRQRQGYWQPDIAEPDDRKSTFHFANRSRYKIWRRKSDGHRSDQVTPWYCLYHSTKAASPVSIVIRGSKPRSRRAVSISA